MLIWCSVPPGPRVSTTEALRPLGPKQPGVVPVAVKGVLKGWWVTEWGGLKEVFKGVAKPPGYPSGVAGQAPHQLMAGLDILLSVT